MLRLRSDLLDLCEAALDGALHTREADWDPRPSMGVVLAAGGYPGSYDKGLAIRGLAEQDSPESKVFHAGTALAEDGETVLTSGGRVLCAAALGSDIVDARNRCYALVDSIEWDGMYCRRDIGWRAIERYSQDNSAS